MAELISPTAFADLFRTFERSAWRWEAQGEYHQADEVEPWQRWRDGVPVADDLAWLSGWLDDVQSATRAGRAFQRVRKLTDPLTEYLRWQMEVTPANVEAGEEIRLLPDRVARELGLPDHDFWIFDGGKVAVLQFGPEGLTGAEIVTEPATVAQYKSWRNLAWTAAVPFDDFVKT
ncbi:DUF6879 family protein [Lentzea sp. NPDC004782]|uniref:DUF6879 family protein n=1 Tax=Lentzea sp. NPDC004782 TaxID=3154458 RepID=UPI0033B4D50E